MQDLDTAIAYYVGRLIYQYQKPNAQATIAILVKQLFGDGLPWLLQDAFNLDQATGPQLDTIGKYIGVPRTIGDPAPLPFFGFVRYAGGGNTNGVTTYLGGTNSNVVMFRYNYNAANATALTDTAYRFMLLFKIGLNNTDHTLAAVQDLLKRLTAGNVKVIDNANMTITYQVGPGLPVSETVLTPFLPKPMGVDITVTTTYAIITGTGDTVVTGSGDTVVAANL